MGYQEQLFDLRQSGVKYSLSPMRRLVASLGHPEQGLAFIHIAGTNGKGSVAAMCAAIGSAAGLRVGLYTSPHLVSYRERFQINGVPISQDRLEEYLSFFEKQGWPGTFFEISTAVALLYFRDAKVDLIAWETGLGGRLDATNVVTPRVSVLTQIGMDHTQILGGTLEAIAAEKAEIIKPGVPVVIAPQEEEALEVLRKKAVDCGSRLRMVTPNDQVKGMIPLAGEHQRINASTAAAAMSEILPEVGSDVIDRGIAAVQWPGRCQRIESDPPVVLDGAHNVQAIDALVKTLPELFGKSGFQLVFAAAKDKDIEAIAGRLRAAPGLRSTVVVRLLHERATSPEILRAYFPGSASVDCWPEAWAKVREEGRPVLVTGSFYLVGEALRYFQQPSALIDSGELWTASSFNI